MKLGLSLYLSHFLQHRPVRHNPQHDRSHPKPRRWGPHVLILCHPDHKQAPLLLLVKLGLSRHLSHFLQHRLLPHNPQYGPSHPKPHHWDPHVLGPCHPDHKQDPLLLFVKLGLSLHLSHFLPIHLLLHNQLLALVHLKLHHLALFSQWASHPHHKQYLLLQKQIDLHSSLEPHHPALKSQ